MKGVLAKSGYNITLKKEEADVWYSLISIWWHRVINTCTVRDKSIQSFRSLYNEAKQMGIKVVIAGCMLEGSFGSFFPASGSLAPQRILGRFSNRCTSDRTHRQSGKLPLLRFHLFPHLKWASLHHLKWASFARSSKDSEGRGCGNHTYCVGLQRSLHILPDTLCSRRIVELPYRWYFTKSSWCMNPWSDDE